MGNFDFFVAPLRCPHCGTVSAADGSTNIQTKLRGDAAYLMEFGVGDRFEYDLADAAGWGYLVVQPPTQPVHFGQMWACPSCTHYPNWAEVVIDGSLITSIEAVPLNSTTLGRLHFLDEDAAPFIADAVGVDMRDAWDELIPKLHAWLAEDPAREL